MAEITGVSVRLSTPSAKEGRLLATSNGTLDTMGGNVACLPQVITRNIIIIIIIDCLCTLISAYIVYQALVSRIQAMLLRSCTHFCLHRVSGFGKPNTVNFEHSTNKDWEQPLKEETFSYPVLT